MSKVLMSIKPIYVDKILSGTKKYEYRKIVPKKRIDTIIIYSTSPIKKVVGEVQILEVLIDEKEKIWELTKEKSGIDKKFYDEYYKNKEVAVAYKIGKITKYNIEKELSDYNINYYPQSFVYLD